MNSKWNMDLNGLNLDGTEFFGSFFLMSLAKNLLILSVFSKNQLLVSLIFSVLISILFLSSLILIVSFLLLTLGFICSFFRIPLNDRLGGLRFFLFFEVGLFATNFPLRTAFAVSHRFWKLVFLFSFVLRYFLISSLISSLTCWFYSWMLLSLHVFVFFPFFFF